MSDRNPAVSLLRDAARNYRRSAGDENQKAAELEAEAAKHRKAAAGLMEQVAAIEAALETLGVRREAVRSDRQATGLRAELERVRREVDTLSAPKAQSVAMQRITARELEKWRRALADLETRWTRLEESAHYASVPKAWLEPQ